MTYLYTKGGRRVRYATAEDFAKWYDVTRQAVWTWIKRRMPAKRVEKLYLIPWIDGRDWVWKNLKMWPRR